MPILDQWNLQIESNEVLRGQGADPYIVKYRRPHLFDMASKAIEEGITLIHPRVLYERFLVKSIHHMRLELSGNNYLAGEILMEHLCYAEEIIVTICTIGPNLEERVRNVMKYDMVYALALDGVGSVATELLTENVCKYFEAEASKKGWKTTIPLNPGMIGWPVEESQRQIFSLLDGSQIGVYLTESNIMIPIKSISFILGLGPEIGQNDKAICDYCSMRMICKYQTKNIPDPINVMKS